MLYNLRANLPQYVFAESHNELIALEKTLKMIFAQGVQVQVQRLGMMKEDVSRHCGIIFVRRDQEYHSMVEKAKDFLEV